MRNRLERKPKRRRRVASPLVVYERAERAEQAFVSVIADPCFGSPSKAAKHAGESKRGTHSQSTEPSRLTNAAVPISPSKA
jgi:hypothetical protein